MAYKILVVEDDPAQRRILEELVKRYGFEVVSAGSATQGLDILEASRSKPVDLIILDLVMPEIDGLEFLERLSAFRTSVPVIVQTAQGSIETVVKAMRAGANDFVVKPVNPERLKVSIQNLLKVNALTEEVKRLNQKVSGTMSFDDLIIASPAMASLVKLGKRAAKSNIPILIEGESGVGKEMIARAIQGESERCGKSFVAVNCGALPENLVESILFGHEKGAFTGAIGKHIGKFQEADGGTLFLDEVAELPLDIQVKLLRALQEGEVDPVGSRKPVKVDIRLISATNRNMIEMVKKGEFREDLYYRLNVFPIMAPPLRDRIEDINPLVQHFITRFAAEEGRRVNGIDPTALELLKSYTWPGNVRQLENTVFRAIVMSEGSELNIADFPQIAALTDGFDVEVPPVPASVAAPSVSVSGADAMIGGTSPAGYSSTASSSGMVSDGMAYGIPAVTDGGHIRKLEEIEADMIRLALNRYRGQMSEVARKLGIGRSTLYRKMRELGLEAQG
ncbi:MAG: sigma-54 dependent transcriptional regulator [Anderseniella sp.]